MSRLSARQFAFSSGMWKPIPAVLALSLALFLAHDVLGSLTMRAAWSPELGDVYVRDYPPLHGLLEVSCRSWAFFLFTPVSVVLRFDRDCSPSLMRLLLSRGVRRLDVLRCALVGAILHSCAFWLAHIVLGFALALAFCTGSYDLGYLKALYDAGAGIFVSNAFASALLLCVGSALLAVSPSIITLVAYIKTGRVGFACSVPIVLRAVQLFGVSLLISIAPLLAPLWSFAMSTLNALFAVDVPIDYALSLCDMGLWAAANLLVPIVCASCAFADRRILLGGR